MSANIHIDDSRWPLIIARLGGLVSEQELEDFLLRSSTYVSRREPFVCITDISQTRIPSARQRSLYAEWIRAHDPLLRRWCLGNATLITSAAMRLSMSLVLHIVRLPVPNITVADMDAALDFVLGKLVEGGLESEARRLQLERGLSQVSSG